MVRLLVNNNYFPLKINCLFLSLTIHSLHSNILYQFSEIIQVNPIDGDAEDLEQDPFAQNNVGKTISLMLYTT